MRARGAHGPQALQQLELCSWFCGCPSTCSRCNREFAPPSHYLGQEDALEKEQALRSSIPGLPSGSGVKASACNVGDPGSIPGLGRSLEKERLPTPVFWSGEIHDCIVPGVAKSQT